MDAAELGERFEWRRDLGAGAMGDVVLARDRASGREVAVKTLGDFGCGDPEARLRFREEFLAMKRLGHARTVEAYDYGLLPGDRPFFTMEYLPGPGLDEIIPVAPLQARQWLIEALEGLDFLHARGYVHGDLKPANLRVGTGGSLELMDFGLIGRAGEAPLVALGTPLYMAPEVIRGERVDGRSDLYSLGAVFYHLIAGRAPFARADARELLRAHLLESPIHLHQLRPEAPADIVQVIMSCLAKARMDRPADARSVLAMLGAETPDEWTHLTSPPLIGREAELATLEAAISSQRDDNACPVCLSVLGAPGMGKSRLLRELQARAQVAGRPVLLSGAGSSTGVPYASLAELERCMVGWAAFRAPAAGEIFQATREAPTGELAPLAARLRRHLAWADLLAALADGERLVLLFDDWDQADEASRELLESLAERTGLPIAIVASARRGGPGTPVVLEPLDTAAIAALAASALGLNEVAPPFAAQLQAASQGAPLIALAMLAEILRTGGLPRVAGRWHTDNVLLSTWRLPTDAAALAAHLIADLAPGARSLLAALARLRRPQPLSRIAAWIGLDEQAAAEASEALAAAGILASDAAGVRLLQAAVAQAVRDGQSPDEARALEAALARGLEQAAPDEALSADLAHHWAGAGEFARAIPHALAGCRYLLGLFSLAEAQALLTLVLDTPAADEAQRAEARSIAGDLARYRGDFELANGHYEAALAYRRAHGGLPIARLLVNSALTCQLVSRYDEALQFATQAVAASLSPGDRGEAGGALITLARLYSRKGDVAAARATAQEALVTSREIGDRASEAEAHGVLGYLMVTEPGTVRQGIAHLDQALALRQALGDKVGLNDAFMYRGNAQMVLGQYPAALDSFRANLALCREIGGAADDEVTALINVGAVLLELGTPGEALAALDEAVRRSVAGGNAFLEGYALGFRGVGRALIGQLAHAEQDTDRAAALATALDNTALASVVADCRATVLAMIGDHWGSLEAAQAGLELARNKGGGVEVLPALERAVGEAYRALGERRRAAKHLEMAVGLAREASAMGLLAKASLGLARLALDARDPSGARFLLLESREAADEAAMAPTLAAIDLAEAALFGAEGRASEAARLARRAHSVATERGLALLAIAAARTVSAWESSEDGAQLLASAEADIAAIADTLAAPWREAFKTGWTVAPGPATAPLLSQELASLPLGEALARLAAPPRANDGMAQVIADFGKLVTGTLHYEEALELIVERVIEVTSAERAIVMLVDGEGALTGLVTLPRPEDSQTSALVGYSRSFAALALRERRSIWIADAQSDERFAAAASVMALDLRTVLCVPLFAGDAVIGLLYVDQRSVNRRFNEADLRLVEGLAGFAALAIANARRYQEAAAQQELQASLRGIGLLVAPEVNWASAAEVIVRQAVFHARAGGVLWAGDPLVARLALDGAGEPCPPACDEDMIARATRTARPQLGLAADGQAPVMVVPLAIGHRLIGLLYFARGTGAAAFSPVDLERLEPLAEAATTTLAAIAHREAQQARIDTLGKTLLLLEDQREAQNIDGPTGTFTLDYLQRKLVAEVAEARRYQQPLALMLLDVRGMAALNERFGRATGDQILQQLAQELRTLSRGTDVVARLGGDEFVVLMPQTALEGGQIYATRLLKRCAAIAVCDVHDEELWRLEVDTALVSWRVHENAATFLERAQTTAKTRV